MFFPSAQLKQTPSEYQLDYKDVWLPIINQQNDNEQLHGWWISSRNSSNKKVILYLHHNAVNISANITQTLQFHKLGYSVFLFDYRGFGQSPGEFPHESQLYIDAQVAWNYLTQTLNIPPHQIIIYGHSLGGAIAIDLAHKHPEAGGLIVHNSFTSMEDMTKRLGIYWLFPMNFLLRQHFESEKKMKSVTMPVLVITSTKDIQIPVKMGKRLYEAAPEFKKLMVIEGGSHDNHLSPEYLIHLQDFLKTIK